MKSALEKWLSSEAIELPSSLQKLISKQATPKSSSTSHPPWVLSRFPHLAQLESIEFVDRKEVSLPLKVGVILSGGQAPGGHNVIVGLLKGLKVRNKDSQLIGFLGGMKGLIKNKGKELLESFVNGYLNSGGFDMIGSGRAKLEKEEDFKKAAETIKSHQLQGVVIIGGDDSNTNAALLAEYLLEQGMSVSVIGVPKTIDGDFRNRHIEMNFGFDTATKVYSEMIGNLLKDLLSQRKYWFFVKLMGRSASHIALECALQTHPNFVMIAEEKKSLIELVQEMKELIEKRANEGRHFGLILIPEGIVENFPEWKEGAQQDAHGNVEVSKLETEKRFIDEVKKVLDPAIPFSAQPFFFGYEGRSALPTKFDSYLTHSLGYLTAFLIEDGVTGVVASITDLKKPVNDWGIHAEPLLPLLTEEERKGKKQPVIAKKVVDLEGKPYRTLLADRERWKWEDDYISPGPIQYSGPRDITWSFPMIL